MLHFKSHIILYILIASVLLGGNKANFEMQPYEIKRFKDWEVICQKPSNNEQGSIKEENNTPQNKEKISLGKCRISQQLGSEEGGVVSFSVLLQKTDDGQYAAIISFPLGGYIAPGLIVTVDKNKSYKLLVETCTQSGCHAGFLMNDQILKQWRKGKTTFFQIWASKDKSATISVSLDGFNEALTYMERL